MSFVHGGAPFAGLGNHRTVVQDLGDLLPRRIHTALADRVRLHLTPHGLATELPTSPHYEADGYWHGLIWAPATVLIEDGLRRAGYTHLADEIGRRFRTCARPPVSPRTATRSPVRDNATARTHGLLAPTSSSPLPLRNVAYANQRAESCMSPPWPTS